MEPAFSLKHKVGKNKSKNSLTDTSFPSSAYDYLKHVQDEAAKCPDIVVADIDCSHFQANQDTNFTVLDSVSSPLDRKPSVQWQQEQTAAFAEVRLFLVQHKALMKKQKEKTKSLPATEDESEWFTFCFGRQKSNVGNQDVQDSELESAAPNYQMDEGTPALLSIICQMNQPTVLSVLDHQISWLKTRSFSLVQGQWIYALLAAVEKPLLADTTYSLRSLARLCARQKESLTSSQHAELAALHLIITMVTRYFGQSDLAEPF